VFHAWNSNDGLDLHALMTCPSAYKDLTFWLQGCILLA